MQGTIEEKGGSAGQYGETKGTTSQPPSNAEGPAVPITLTAFGIGMTYVHRRYENWVVARRISLHELCYCLLIY